MFCLSESCPCRGTDKLHNALVYDDLGKNANDEQAAGDEQMSVYQNALELGHGQYGNAGKNDDGTEILEQMEQKLIHSLMFISVMSGKDINIFGIRFAER